MTKEELAAKLNGREYREEFSAVEEREACESGLLIVYGASDDLLEFAGVIRDEVGAWNGAEVKISPDKKIWDEDFIEEHENDVFFLEWQKNNKLITVGAKWCPPGFEGSFLITTDAPAASFDIMEDGGLYCRGIVIDMNEVFGEVAHA